MTQHWPRRLRVCAVVGVVLLVGGCTSAGGLTAGSGAPTAEDALPTDNQPTNNQPTNDGQPGATTVPSPVTASTPATGSAGSATSSAALPDVGVTGVNPATCHSTDLPVVLLHGILGSVALTFAKLAPALIASGRCVYGLDYGNGGLARISYSAAAVAQFVRTVLRRSGAQQVDMIGYSEGGLVTRTALRQDALAPLVRVAVLISPDFNGTTAPLAASVPANLCPSCQDQVAGSPLIRSLNAGGDLDGAVRYAVIATEDDTVVTPVSSQFPTGPADRLTTLLVQHRCPALHPTHQQMPGVAGVINWTIAALHTDGRPPPSALTCS